MTDMQATQEEERELPELYLADKEVIRSTDGKFLPGASGNPKGRPKGTKNRITELKQEMELVLREGINPEVLKSIVASMAAEAINGNVQAAKLILDRFITNASTADDDAEANPTIRIEIKNLTPQGIKDVVGETIQNEEIPDG